jgi:hypothetical protein
VLAEGDKLTRPYPVPYCGNPDCLAALDRDAYALYDGVTHETVVYCDVCARSAIKFHPDRFKPVA